MHHIIALAHVYARIPPFLGEKYFHYLHMVTSLIILGDLNFCSHAVMFAYLIASFRLYGIYSVESNND
jgi:hypothetical protein